MIEIVFTDVGMAFGAHQLWQHLDAAISGGVTAVTGANGSGKSTFLRLAARLLRPSAGEVVTRQDGQLLTAAAYSQLWGLDAPECQCYPELTAVENVRFAGSMRGRTLADDRIEECLQRVGLPQAAIRDERYYVRSFSTGMRQRLKLALLLAVDPAVWLLDEPGANLDASGRAMVLDIARTAARQGHIVLLATNEAKEAEAADELINLDRF